MDGIGSGVDACLHPDVEFRIILGNEFRQRVGVDAAVAGAKVGVADREDVVRIVVAGVPAVPRLYGIEGLGGLAGDIEVVGFTDLSLSYLACDIYAAVDDLFDTAESAGEVSAVMVLEGCGIAVVPGVDQERHVIHEQLSRVSHILSPRVGIGLAVHGVSRIIVGSGIVQRASLTVAESQELEGVETTDVLGSGYRIVILVVVASPLHLVPLLRHQGVHDSLLIERPGVHVRIKTVVGHRAEEESL